MSSGRREAGGEGDSRGSRAAAPCQSHIAAMQLFHELKQQFPALPDDAVSACIAEHCQDPAICHSQLSLAAAPRSLPYPDCLRNIDEERRSSNTSSEDFAISTPILSPKMNFSRKFSRSDEEQNSNNAVNPKFKFNRRLSEDRNDFNHFEPLIINKNRKTSLRNENMINNNCSNFGRLNLSDEDEQQSTTNSSDDLLPQKSKPNSKILNMSEESKSIKNREEYTNEVSTGNLAQSVVSERTSDLPSDSRDFLDFSPSSCFRTKPPISPLTSKRPPGRVTKATYDARITKLPENNPTNATGTVKKAPAVRPASLDLPRRTSDSVENKTSPVQQGVNLSVNVNCSVDLEEGGNGSRRHRAVLEVTPEPTWLHPNPSYSSSPPSFTSVNLTLRTPTTPPSGPIDICSSPASLTYTTSSWDRRQGLQSRLEITVGPVSGCVTATRTRPRSSCFQEEGERVLRGQRAESMPDLTARVEQTTNCVVLISRQKERKEQLQIELKVGRERLYEIQKEIQALKLEYTPDFRTRLVKEIRHLQAQCERLTQEVDRHSENRVPLGETNEEFYRHIYTGQRYSSQRRRVPHHRDANPAASDPDNEPRWPCHICTFRNHPLMDKCEQCEMPRVLLGKIAAPANENPTAVATENPPHANTPLALGMNS